MKRKVSIRSVFLIISFLSLFVSCKKEETNKEMLYPKEEVTTLTAEALGKEIFEGKGNCISCHQTDQKVIGPSLQEIAKIYKDKNGNIVHFLKGESGAIVDPAQFALMQANIELTKTFSDEELKALEAYIYSNLE